MMADQPQRHDLAREHADLAGVATGAAPGAGMGAGAGECGSEHGLRGRTREPGAPRGTSPDRNTRFVETTRGILSYAQLAPMLGDRVLACEEAIVTGKAGPGSNCGPKRPNLEPRAVRSFPIAVGIR